MNEDTKHETIRFYWIEQFICTNALPWSAISENNEYHWVQLPIKNFTSFNEAIKHAEALPQKELRISNGIREWTVS